MSIRKAIAMMVVAVAAIPSAGSAAVDTKLPDGSAASTAAELHTKAEDTARGFKGGLGSQLRHAAGTTEASPVSTGAVTLGQALTMLYAAAGVRAAAPADLPPTPVADAVAPLVAAAATAGRMVNVAFSALTPSERSFVLANIATPATQPGSDLARRVAKLSSRVDMVAVNEAAALYADALDAFPAEGLQLAASWTDPTGMVEIGTTANESFGTERVLIVDLGGDDYYPAHPGSVGPGWSQPLPVSAVLDLGGNDYYSAQSYDATTTANNAYGIGVGLGGVGLIVDRWGNDSYSAYAPYPSSLPCRAESFLPQVYAQQLLTQGVGALGVGAIADLSGSDYYQAIDQQWWSVPCHWTKIYAYAQGAGLNRGLGLLADDTGNDFYYAFTYSTGTPGNFNHQDKLAQTHAQGFGAGGAGFLVDKEGNDFYYAQAYAQFGNSMPTKGSFAYVYAQGAVFGLTESYANAIQTGPLVAPAAGTPAVPGYCLGSSGASGGGQGGTSLCNGAGVGMLVDILGSDTFDASATSYESPDACAVASHAVTSAQGSAAWGGLAMLANLDAAGTDQFNLAPAAYGGPCPLAAMANAYGQGFGGPVYASLWDNAPALTRAFTTGAPLPAASIYAPPVGVLVSGGAPCRETALKLDPSAALTPGCTLGASEFVASPDSYFSSPYASSQTGRATAESWVQGASGVPSYSFLPSGLPIGQGYVPTGMGVGVNADSGGDDVYASRPRADGKPGSSVLSMAQASTNSGIAALVNVGGADQYESRGVLNGADQPGSSFGQGYALAWYSTLIPATAAFVDVAGNDVYTYPAGCATNGSLTAPAIWGGTIAGGCAQAGTNIVGIDAASGLQL